MSTKPMTQPDGTLYFNRKLKMEKMLQWYDEAKVGIFIHFGVYAVPGFRSEWFWCFWQCPDRIHPPVVDFMKKNYRPGFTYQDFAADFKLV